MLPQIRHQPGLSGDWTGAAVTTRRNNQETPDKGGWNAHCTYTAGYDLLNPGSNPSLNAVGRSGFVGWPTNPRLASLRSAWFDAPDLAAQQRICAEIQADPARSALYSARPVFSGDGVSQYRQQYSTRCFLAVLANSQDRIVNCGMITRVP